MVRGTILILAGCAINYIPIQWVHRAKDAVSLILSILSLLGCWFGFSLIVGPSLFQYGLEPLLFATGLALLGWSIRMIVRGFQVGKVIPLITGFIGLFPAMSWMQTGSPVISEAWTSLAYGLSALVATNGINHFVRFFLGYVKKKQIYILHIVYGIVLIGLAATGAGYATTQSELYLNTAAILMAVGLGYFLFITGYKWYQEFKNQPEMTEEERERIQQGIFRKFSPSKN